MDWGLQSSRLIKTLGLVERLRDPDQADIAYETYLLSLPLNYILTGLLDLFDAIEAHYDIVSFLVEWLLGNWEEAEVLLMAARLIIEPQ